MDAVASLGAVKIPSPGSHPFLHAEREMPKSKNAVPVSDRDWNLALARVLIQDSSYEFSESFSVLDIPWPDPEVLEWRGLAEDDRPDLQSFESDRQWESFTSTNGIRYVFSRFFHGNDDFNIGENNFKTILLRQRIRTVLIQLNIWHVP